VKEDTKKVTMSTAKVDIEQLQHKLTDDIETLEKLLEDKKLTLMQINEILKSM
jgi:hypothetical protein